MLDLISIGDGTVDTFINIHDASVHCSVDSTNCKLCVEYGKKIPVDNLVHLVGGNACNNAVGCSRLGLKTAAYINIGGDNSGKQIFETLKKEKVSTHYVVTNSEMESNYSALLLYKGERTIFVYHQQWEYHLPELDAARWVYFSSPSQSFVHSHLTDDITRYLERTGAKFVYTPGTFQIKMDIKKTPRLLSLTELFIVNKEEAKLILKIKDDESVTPKKLLKGIHDLGPKMVIITDSKHGSFGFDGENYFKVPALAKEIVDTTGAGDAYATGVLASLYYGNPLKEAMKWGAINSASVIKQIGAQPGLLTDHQLESELKEQHSKIVIKEL